MFALERDRLGVIIRFSVDEAESFLSVAMVEPRESFSSFSLVTSLNVLRLSIILFDFH